MIKYHFENLFYFLIKPLTKKLLYAKIHLTIKLNVK